MPGNDARSETLSIRPPLAKDAEFIKGVAVRSGLFDPEGASEFDAMLTPFFAGESPEHHWLLCEHDGKRCGAAYFAPEPFADRMWNIYFLAVAPESQSKGIGAALLSHIEDFLNDRTDKAQTVTVETSSKEEFSGTRQFYEKQGFVEEARVRDFYGTNDNKVVFWKALKRPST